MNTLAKSSAENMVLRSLIITDRRTNQPLFYIPTNLSGGIDFNSTAAMIATDASNKGKPVTDYKVFVEASVEETAPLTARTLEIMQTQLLKPSPQLAKRESVGRLTPKQKQVLAMLEEGRGNKDIARELHICERTAKFHVSCLLERFGVTTRYELAHKLSFGYREEDEAIREGLKTHSGEKNASDADSSRRARKRKDPLRKRVDGTGAGPVVPSQLG